MDGCFHQTSSRFCAALRDAMAPRQISLAEVEKHVAYDDLWLVIAGKVYDVTAFMDDHPGGGEIMLNAAGKDGTDDFEDVGHSPNAYEQLKKFYIGEYAGGASGRADGGAKKSATGGMTTGGFGALGATLLPVAGGVVSAPRGVRRTRVRVVNKIWRSTSRSTSLAIRRRGVDVGRGSSRSFVVAATASTSNLRASNRPSQRVSRVATRARRSRRAMFRRRARGRAARVAAPRGRAVAHFGVGNELLVCDLDDGARAEAPRARAWGRATARGARVAASTSAALLTLRAREVRAESDERRRCDAMRFVSPEGDLVFKSTDSNARRDDDGRRTVTRRRGNRTPVTR